MKTPPNNLSKEVPDAGEIIREEREKRTAHLFLVSNESFLCSLASERGLNWDEMSEDEQEGFTREYLRE